MSTSAAGRSGAPAGWSTGEIGCIIVGNSAGVEAVRRRGGRIFVEVAAGIRKLAAQPETLQGLVGFFRLDPDPPARR